MLMSLSPALPAPDLLERVRAAARLVADDDEDADAVLRRLHADTADPVGAEARLVRLAVGALVARRAGAAADIGNLYGGAAGPAEMLRAFQSFVEDMPLVRFGHRTANAAHLAAIGDADAACILDVGLGMGSQWDPLLRALAARPGGPPRLHLIGLDLPAPGPNPAAALESVGARLTRVAADCGVPFRFTALPGRVEDVDLPQATPGERLTINAVLALHHTGVDDRDATLQRLAATGADALVLCEPEADHDAPGFLPRLDAALHHYGLLFRVLERCLPPESEARAVIEGQFFGRELHNVVVGEGPARVERHAPTSDWSRRLRLAGLRPFLFADAGAFDLPAGVAVVSAGPARALTVDGAPLVVVSAWAPAATA